MKIIFSKKIRSIAEAEETVSEILPHLKSGNSIGMVGELGAGKTTLSKILVRKLGSADDVTSPSYVLQHEYAYDSGIIEHWDLYRLRSCPLELFEPVKPGNFRLIEWSNKFSELEALLNFVISIEVLSEDIREIKLATY